MSDDNFLKGEGDRFLISNIRQGDDDSFRQLVDRFSGRLQIYAARRLRGSGIDAEDAVQETFLGLLQSLERTGRVRSLQAYLFQILRNKIADLTQKRPEAHGMRRVPLISEDAQGDLKGYDPVAPDKTPSTYARRKERVEARSEVLTEVLDEVLDEMKKERRFRDLKVLQLLFYSSWRNRKIAKAVGTSEPTVTRIKTGTLEKLARLVRRHPKFGSVESFLDTDDDPSDLIRDTWKTNLLSCLKRSTLGSFALNTLDGEWYDYVSFHLDTVGCEMCAANVEDLRAQDPTEASELRERIFSSSIGFLKKPD